MPACQPNSASQEELKRPLMLSGIGHACLALCALAYTLVPGLAGGIWDEGGGGGGAATVQLVSAASVPLPTPRIPTTNRVVTESAGLHYPEPPAPKPTPPKPVVEEKAVQIPSRNAKVVPKAAVKPPEPPTPRLEIARTGRNATPLPRNARKAPADLPKAGNEIPFGQGGPVTGPYGMIQSDDGSGGINVIGGPSGNFGNRYRWYVTAIRNRISNNWLKSSIDPNIRVAPRVFVTFQIMRDGRVVNPQLTSSSGISSLDRSALRAVYDSSPMPSLPSDYRGPGVSVEFWFDFQR